MSATTNYKVGDWVFTDEWGRGTGKVVMDLGGGLLRVRFGRSETTIRATALRPATEQEAEGAR